MSLPARPRYHFHVKSGSCASDDVLCFDPSDRQGLSGTGQELSCSSLDKLMNIAYGDKLLYSDGGPRDSLWCQRWSVIIQHMGQHYSLPGGSIGKKYIDLLYDEVQYLSLGTYRSKCLIVFCSVMLQ